LESDFSKLIDGCSSQLYNMGVEKKMYAQGFFAAIMAKDMDIADFPNLTIGQALTFWRK